MSVNYVALKTDIIGSRRITDRSQVQKRFLTIAQQVNSQFNQAFAAGFIVTHGDEAQGLIKTNAAELLMEMVICLTEMIAPNELRFGIGYGTLNTEIQELAIGMDGQAWQNAKTALETARRTHQLICFTGFEPKKQTIMEALANLILFTHSHWTTEQLEAIKLVRAGLNQTSIASKLGVSEAAISKRLAAAGWHEYAKSLIAWKTLFTLSD